MFRQTLLAICMLSCVLIRQANARPQSVVFLKKLADKRNLVVVRKQVPVPPLTQEQTDYLKNLQKTDPGAQIAKPDRVWKYSLYVVSADKKSRHILWQKTVQEIYDRGDFQKFFDAVYEGDTLVLVYEVFPFLQGEVITRQTPKITPAYSPERFLSKDYSRDLPSVQGPIQAATIHGSLKQGTLRIVVKKGLGGTLRFRWKQGQKQGHWIDESTGKIPTVEEEYQRMLKKLFDRNPTPS